MQQQLKELNLDEPAFAHCPALLGAQLGTPEYEQFDSAQEDTEEDEGDASGTPQGTQLACPWLIGTTEGIMPCEGSKTGHVRNSVGPRADG